MPNVIRRMFETAWQNITKPFYTSVLLLKRGMKRRVVVEGADDHSIKNPPMGLGEFSCARGKKS